MYSEQQLIELTQLNGSFSKSVPGLQTTWDSTSLGLLKTCPRKYALSMLDGWQKSFSLPLSWGIWFHSACETFEKTEGDFDTRLRAAVRAALTMTWIDGRPFESDSPQRTRETLVRTVVWYFDHFKDDPVQTHILSNGRPAIELKFTFEGPRVSGQDFLVCGHLDRIGRFNDELWILDRKTTASTLSPYYFSRYSPDNQMSLYAIAGQIITGEPTSGVIIDAIQVAVGFSRFARGFAGRTKDLLDEWWKDLEFWLLQAMQFAQARYWPANDKSCGMYGGCPFQDICSKNPGTVREAFLETNFVKRTWDPTIERE